MVNKITFIGFSGGDRPNRSLPWIRPCSDPIWANVQSMEPNLSDLCEQETTGLLPFPNIYLCETGFSTLTMV